MVEPLRHRQTKGAATDMPGLPPPRHIPTLPNCASDPTHSIEQQRGGWQAILDNFARHVESKRKA